MSLTLLLTLSLAAPIKVGGFTIESSGASGGTMHCAQKVVLAYDDSDGARSTTFAAEEGCLPLFTRAFKVSDSQIIALGWSSGGGGRDSHIAWLISTAPDAPVLLDTVTLYKPRSAPSLSFNDKTHALAFSADCPEREPTKVFSLRGLDIPLCTLKDTPLTGATWSTFSDTPASKKSTSARLVVTVKNGAFARD